MKRKRFQALVTDVLSKKRFKVVKIVILTVIGQYTFSIFFLFWIKNLLFTYCLIFISNRQRWAAILVKIVKVKE